MSECRARLPDVDAGRALSIVTSVDVLLQVPEYDSCRASIPSRMLRHPSLRILRGPPKELGNPEGGPISGGPTKKDSLSLPKTAASPKSPCGVGARLHPNGPPLPTPFFIELNTTPAIHAPPKMSPK